MRHNQSFIPDVTCVLFFFVNEPQPDDPEAIEASSLELVVCLVDIAGFVDDVPRVDDGGCDGAAVLMSKSSSDGNWLTFEEGL